MRTQFLIIGTLVGGLVLSVLGWITAAILPPRYKQFKDANAVVQTIQTNVAGNGIYTAPQGLFTSVSFRPDLSNRLQTIGLHLVSQFVIEFAVALGLSVILVGTSIRSPLRAASFLGLIGLVAGVEVRFPEWNWAGFPTSHLLAGIGYLAGNWFLTGLALGTVRRKLDLAGSAKF
jgi:hypothetical protein